ncbi:MAG: hypothetical protein AAB847_01445 [Patescibacteria group bacterium]
MDKFEDLSGKYLETLTERSKKSKIYKSYQLLGLTLAEILDDNKHKSIYMKMAKKHNGSHLLHLAKKIAEKKNIINKGAYFMKIFYGNLDNKK